MDTSKLPDEDLALFVRAHEKRAFGEIVKRFEDRVMLYANSLSENELNAYNLALDTFTKAYQNLRYYDPKLKFSSFIFRVAHSLSKSPLKKEITVLHFNLKLGYDEISDILEIPENIVINTLSANER